MVLTETDTIVTTTCVATAYSWVFMPDPRAKRKEGTSTEWMYLMFKGHYIEPDQNHYKDPE